MSWEYTTSTTFDFFLHYVQSVLEWKVSTKSSHCAQNFTFTWSVLRIHNFNNFWLLLALCTICFGMKSQYKKFTLCPKLYFYLKRLENTRLQQLLTSSCIMYNLFWNEKLVQKVLALCTICFGMKSQYKKFTLCPKLYFPYHHLYIHSFFVL